MKVIGNIRFLSLDELSNFLGLSKVTLRSYIKTGKLDGRKIGQRWYVTEHSVSKLVKGSDYDNKPLEYENSNSIEQAPISSRYDKSQFSIETGSNVVNNQPIDFFSFIASKIDTHKQLKNEHDKQCEFWIDPKGLITYISPVAELISEFSPEEFAKKPSLILETIHPNDREWVSKSFAEGIVNKTRSNLFYRIVTKYGKLSWINHQSTPIFLPDGRYLGRQIIMREITESKLAETSIAELWPHIDYNTIISAPIIFFNDARIIVKSYNINSLLASVLFDQQLNVGETIDATTGGPNINKLVKCLDYLDNQRKYSTKLTIAHNPRIEINCYAFRLEIPPIQEYYVVVLM